MSRGKRMLRAVAAIAAAVVMCSTAAGALTLPDAEQLFYISGAASKSEISQYGDADEQGNYPLSYTTVTALPDLLGELIVQFHQFVTDFSFRIDVVLNEGLVPDTESLVLDCPFGEITDASVAGRMMYVELRLKSGTQLSDYTQEQWTSPIMLSFDAVLEGESFRPGEQIEVAMSVDGSMAGSHPLVGSLALQVKGVMDPEQPVICTKMIAGEQPHSEEEAVPPIKTPNATVQVDTGGVAEVILSSILPEEMLGTAQDTGDTGEAVDNTDGQTDKPSLQRRVVGAAASRLIGNWVQWGDGAQITPQIAPQGVVVLCCSGVSFLIIAADWLRRKKKKRQEKKER